jgi:imidazolonepropionase
VVRDAAGGVSGLPGLLVEGAGSIATLAGGLRRGSSQGDAAVLEATNGGFDGGLAVAAWDGEIVAVGTAAEVLPRLRTAGLTLNEFRRVDGRGCLVTPGLIDSHTHLVFAGTREVEWRMRLRGASYLDVLAAGGGILSTVAATRAATADELAAGARRRLAEMLACGTTTAEAKSGYGLDVESELRILGVVGRLADEGPVELLATFLGAHAVPPEFRKGGAGGKGPGTRTAGTRTAGTRTAGTRTAGTRTAAAGSPDTDAYVASVIAEQLPRVAEQGIARFCDVFCEAGVFSRAQAAAVFAAAERLGLPPRVHADELGPSGGAELAAEIGCLSADHLAAPSEEGIAALASAAATDRPVVATLLPATSWFMGKHHFAPARRFIDAGIPVALATDLNPGTSPTVSLPLVMSVACLEMGLTPAEALVAVTANAAHSLGVGDRLGSIEPGRQADLVVWDVPSVDQLPYWLGSRPARVVVKRGRVVIDRSGA